MVNEKKIRDISCEEAKNLADLYFENIGGDAVANPYLKHIGQCAKCRQEHQQRMEDILEIWKNRGSS